LVRLVSFRPGPGPRRAPPTVARPPDSLVCPPVRRPLLTFAISLTVGLTLLPSAVGVAAAITPTFTKESYTTFQSQLASGQVRAVTFNKKAHSLHITVTKGGPFLASYPPLQYKAISAHLTAKGVPVTIEHVTKTGTAAPAAHHKLRYIAAGVLVVVVIVIVLVLGLNRRRPPADEAGDAPAAPPAAGSPPEPEAPATGD